MESGERMSCAIAFRKAFSSSIIRHIFLLLDVYKRQDQKYGFRDYRGGGRSSGRETIGRVAGGAVAMNLLEQLGISITAYASSIGPVTAKTFCPEEIDNNPFHLPDAEAAAMAQEYVDRMMEEKESSGGVIAVSYTHLDVYKRQLTVLLLLPL